MATRIVDPSIFAVESAVIDWTRIARRRHDVERLIGNAVPRVLQIRWMINGEKGMPSEPFVVWRRVSGTKPLEEDLNPDTWQFGFGVRLLSWETPVSNVSIEITGGATGCDVVAVCGAPIFQNVISFAHVNPGPQRIELSGFMITGLMISGSIGAIGAVRGVPTGKMAGAPDWERVEIVGLPVEPSEWNDVGDHAQKQGLIGALTDPKKAAVERILRGQPLVGWEPEISPALPAPPWQAPVPPKLVDELNESLLPRLHDTMLLKPIQQLLKKFGVTVPPPQNSAGDSMTGDDQESFVSALGLTLLSASTDPFLSLALGFGTAYPWMQIVLGDRTITFDYMITARWSKGFDGISEPVEYAAYVPNPRFAIAPPAPAGLFTERLGFHRPEVSDAAWTASVRMSWERLPQQTLLRVGSFAAARAVLAPAKPSVMLLTKRKSGGFKPVAANTAGDKNKDIEAWRLHAVDRSLRIPTNPGSTLVRYAAATQDIFGLWSPWKTADINLIEPALEKVSIVNAEFHQTVPGAGTVCPASLVVDFLCDWRVRRPQSVRLIGKLYKATHRGSPPPDNLLPPGLSRSLGVAGLPFDITFAGDVASAPGATIQALSSDGESLVAFGPAQGAEARRYRVTIPGSSLDYATTGHIGFALWARVTERIAPHRISNWQDQPYLAAASDPRPPVVIIEHVNLASLPDAAGQCHARIAWSGSPGAVGYFIYEATETKILSANGLDEPDPAKTLDDRLLKLKQTFHANPSRREFTRRNASPLKGTSTDITIPRGTAAIHVFVVLGVSAGQVEAAWPSGLLPEDALIAVAAPRVMVPAVPTIEVRQILDKTAMPPVYKARLAVNARPGPRVQRVELFRVRVDDAAREVDTMGPPIATITNTAGPFVVTRVTDPGPGGVNHVVALEGVDAPQGSWKRVWYRAVAWSDDDPTHGALRGRSPASSAAWVVVPPPTPPDLSVVTAEWPGGPLGDVLLKWKSSAPVETTALGAHRINVSAEKSQPAPSDAPLIRQAADLEKLPTAAPGTGSGAWRIDPPAKPVEYRALLRRAAVTDAISVAIRLTDPLGRTSERILEIGAGPVDPAPEIIEVSFAVVPGKGMGLTFASTNPVVATSAGSYMLTLTAVAARTLPPIVVRPGPGGGPFRPLPGGGLAPLPPRNAVVNVALGSIPIFAGPGLPPISERLTVWRKPGGGRKRTYAALSTIKMTRFLIRITAPDGRFAEVVQEVS